MVRPRLNVLEVNKNYKDVLALLAENKVFVCQFEQGTCVFLDNKYNFIMFNPHNKEITSVKMNEKTFLDMYNNVFMSDPDYQFFGIETDGHSIKEVFVGVTEALMCLKTGNKFGEYRIKK